MKKIFALILTAALVSALSINTVAAETKSKTLIVYFSLHKNQEHILSDADSSASRTLWHGEIHGNNDILAQLIAGKLGGADIIALETAEKYDDDRYGVVRQQAKTEQAKKTRVVLKTKVNARGYENIIIGYPNWWNDMPRAMYTFFEETDLSGKNVYLYTSTLGSGFSRTISEIEKLAPKAKVNKNGLNVASSRVADVDKEIDSWLMKVGLK